MLMPSRIALIESGGVSIQPDCPTCGGGTIRKAATSGPRTGSEVWSCARYPQCRGTIAVAANVRSAAARLREAAAASTTTYRPSTGAILPGLARPTDIALPIGDEGELAIPRISPSETSAESSAEEPAELSLWPRSVRAMAPVTAPSPKADAIASTSHVPNAPFDWAALTAAGRAAETPDEAIDEPQAAGGLMAVMPEAEAEEDFPVVFGAAADPDAAPLFWDRSAAAIRATQNRGQAAQPAPITTIHTAATVARRGLEDVSKAAPGAVTPRTPVSPISPLVAPIAAPTGGAGSMPGASAQAEFDRRVARHRVAMQATLPTVVAVTILGMAAAGIAFGPYGSLIAALGAAAVGLLGASFVGRLPADAIRWRSHAIAERRTAEVLEPLESAGYIVLHDRTVPGVEPNIDHIAIGPGGVFVIETRQAQGALAFLGEKLFVGDRTGTALVEGTYREAVAVQIALSDTLGPARLTVQPILCVHETPQLLREAEVEGLRIVSGSELVPFLRRQPVVLRADEVQALAAKTDRRLRPAAA